MSNVINIVPNKASADEIFEDCKGQFNEVLIIGWDHDNLMKAKSSSTLDIKDVVYMMEVFKQALISTGYDTNNLGE